MVKTIFYTIFTALVFAGAAFAGATYVYMQEYNRQVPIDAPVAVSVVSGQSTSGIAATLKAQGLINNALVFTIAARLDGVAQSLKAGEYEIQPGMNMGDILQTMTSGDVVQYKFTIPEGYTAAQILDVISAQDKLVGEVPNMLIEGTILPDTYYYVRGEKRSELIARLQSQMNFIMNTLWTSGRSPSKYLRNTMDVITLASIVEKETGVAEERRRIAGLFLNRLRHKMRLQSDPTVIYAITAGDIETEGQGPLGRRILRKDLEFDSPYNTYKNVGLPPGPICSPGLESIKAVLKPEKHDYLYMVADGTGGHAFGKTLDEHNRNVAKWRKIRAQQ